MRLNDFFTKNEIVTYKNFKDLVQKIKFYKKNDKLRKIIANKGRKKYLKEFSSEKISKFIISKTLNIKNNENFLWFKNKK